MIAARVGNKLLLILEPGNIEKIKIGKPLIVPLNKFMPELGAAEVAIAYSPDVTWVIQQVKAGAEMTTAIAESLERSEVFLRDDHDPESLTNVKI